MRKSEGTFWSGTGEIYNPRIILDSHAAHSLRVAALKCRQRKKQWLANLQAKVEIFSSENDNLSAQVSNLREEIVSLKTILLQHKDCPVSQSQGLGGYFQQEQFNPHANPYGMGIQNGQVGMAGQRRQ